MRSIESKCTECFITHKYRKHRSFKWVNVFLSIRCLVKIKGRNIGELLVLVYFLNVRTKDFIDYHILAKHKRERKDRGKNGVVFY